RLLIPQVADVVYPIQRGIVESHIRLFGASDPVDPFDWMSDAAGRLRDGDGLGDRAEQGTLRRVEYTARVELDDDAQYVVVGQEIGILPGRGGDPRREEGVGTQPGDPAAVPPGRCRSLLVVPRERRLAPPRQSAHAALDHIPRRIVVQDIEPEGE